MNAQFLKKNPIFWSRLGGEWYPPLFDPDGKPYYGYTEGQIPTLQRYHRDFAEQGVHIHSIILDGGWIGEDTYDYRVTDLQLKHLFEADPAETLRIKPDENSGVGWVRVEDIPVKSTEPWFCERIYSKLCEKATQRTT